jgi:serine/threonine protein kinase
MSFQPEDRVSTYRIVARLGSGGMGEVFQVEHLITKRVEALKILSGPAASTPEQRQRFLREIQLQAGLSHPHIAAVHNAFWENERLVMVMELIRGRSLASLLAEGRLRLGQSLDYARQALAALEYAHAHGVVHRDISPSNMIVTEDGTLKLTDFGLAKSMTDLRITLTGTLVGSLYYTSPEQVRGSVEADGRSDIYSLGAVLYEMAAGTKPFYSENPFTLMLAHVEQPPRRPGEVNASLPAGLDEILLKALEKDPEKRFQSAEVFGRALETLADGRITESEPHAQTTTRAPLMLTPARPLTDKQRAAPPWSRYWQAAGALIVVLVAALAMRGTYQGAFNSSRSIGKILESADLADLPFIWPANLVLVPDLRYRPKRRGQAEPMASMARPVALMATQRQPAPPQSTQQPAAQEQSIQEQVAQPQATQDRARKKNSLLRAMGRVVHPFHRDSQAANVRDTPPN